jgi:hypothetical protein
VIMWKKPESLITRLGERDGTLRVEAHIYGIDVRIDGNKTYSLTVEEATKLRDRLTQCLDDIASHDSITGEPIEQE